MKDSEIDRVHKLSKYLKQGIYQDFQKMKFIQVCFYFCLADILISQILSLCFDNDRIHFTKEIARWSMNIVFSLLSYLMGRKQEKELIKNKLGIDDLDED